MILDSSLSRRELHRSVEEDGCHLVPVLFLCGPRPADRLSGIRDGIGHLACKRLRLLVPVTSSLSDNVGYTHGILRCYLSWVLCFVDLGLVYKILEWY